MARFEIQDVARLNGLEHIGDHGNEMFFVCPFCGNKRKKFSVNNQKGQFHCWSCGSGGSALTLHAKLNPHPEYEDPVDGKKRICRDIYRLIEGSGETVLKERYAPAEDILVPKRADNEISAVNIAMLSLLTLKDEHKADLLKRGLSPEMIKSLKFKSIEKRQGKAITRQLLKMGFSLEGVPGFYMDKKGDWSLKIPANGYLCPVYDGDYKQILGFQIHTDKVEGKDMPKYIWLASSNLWEGCTKGCSSGSIATCLPGEDQNSVIVVEGILKAAVTWFLLDRRITVVGIPGVNTLKGLTPFLERYSDRYFYEAFDMDGKMSVDMKYLLKKPASEYTPEEAHYMEKTQNIKDATQNLYRMMEKYGVAYHGLKWDNEQEYWKGQYKGLDDFLLAYPRRDLFENFIVQKSEDYAQMRQFFR